MLRRTIFQISDFRLTHYLAEGKLSQRTYARLREAVDEVGAALRSQLQAIKLSDLISGSQLARLA
jgi:hypothetical protein